MQQLTDYSWTWNNYHT